MVLKPAEELLIHSKLISMKHKSVFILTVLLCFIVVASRAQNQRANVVVAPYTVNVYTVDGSGNPVNLVTSSSSIQENTVYHVTVSTSSSSSNVAGLLCRLFDGFEAGLWSGGGFVPYANPAQAQGDGTSFAFLIRTFSGWDFVLPLSMRTYECWFQLGSCDNPGGTGWQNQKLIAFP